MSHNILSKCDRAVVAYLIGVGAGDEATILPAKRSIDKPLPCVIVFSSHWRLISAGVYEVDTSLMIKTPASVDVDEEETDRKSSSETLVGLVADAMFAGIDENNQGHKLAEEITNAARASADPGDADLQEFTMQNIEISGGEQGIDKNGPAWVDTIEVKSVVCPKNVS